MQVFYEQQLYIFQVLNQHQVNRYRSEIQILLNQVTLTLVLDQHGWRAKNEAVGCPTGLANTIGAAIAERYRM